MKIAPDFHKKIREAFDAHDIAAVINVPFLAEKLKDNPSEGIGLIYKTYEDGLNQAYTDERGHNNRAFIQGLAGGPMETVPWAVYNAVGDVYPYLEKKDRFDALRQVLRCLDQNNTKYVQDTHTPGIREPILLTDIAITRPPYWPGLDEGWSKIKKYSTFTQLAEELIDKKTGMFRKDKIQSDFVMAWVLLCSEWSKWGEDYSQAANPDFLQRTLKGIVNYCFHNRKGAESINSEIAAFKSNLPKSLHDKIKPFVEERDWPSFKDFK